MEGHNISRGLQRGGIREMSRSRCKTRGYHFSAIELTDSRNSERHRGAGSATEGEQSEDTPCQGGISCHAYRTRLGMRPTLSSFHEPQFKIACEEVEKKRFGG